MDLHGWDIVSACRQDDLNKLLAKRMANDPPTLSYTDSTGIKIDGVFDPWEISSFGTDTTLTLTLPFKSGTLKNTSKFSTKPTVKLDGVKVEISVQLDFVDNAAGTASDLKFNFGTKATSPSDKQAGAVWCINADLDGTLKGEDPSGDSTTDLREHIPQVLIANADKLNYALTSLNLAPAAKQSWLKPLKKNFMFAKGPTDANGKQEPGHLVVALMVRDLPDETRTSDIDPSLVAGDSAMTMAFAKDLFLEHFIMPTLPSSFVGASSSGFIMMGDKIGHLPFPTPLRCKDVEHWGTGYTPYLGSFFVSIDDDELATSASGFFDITGLAKSYVTFDFNQKFKAAFDASTQKLSFKAYGGANPNYEKHIPWWVYALSAVALPAVGLIVAAVVAAIVDIVIAAVTTAVSKQVTGTGGGAMHLGDLAAAIVAWPGSDAITVEKAGLDDAFVVRGKIN